jgi:hypothetical protein
MRYRHALERSNTSLDFTRTLRWLTTVVKWHNNIHRVPLFSLSLSFVISLFDDLNPPSIKIP